MPDRDLLNALGLLKEHDPKPEPTKAPTDEDGSPMNQGEIEALRRYAETQARATRAILPRGSWSEEEGRKHR